MNRDCIVVSRDTDFGSEHHVLSICEPDMCTICIYDGGTLVQSIVKNLVEAEWNVVGIYTQPYWNAMFADVYRVCPSLVPILGSSWFICSMMDK